MNNRSMTATLKYALSSEKKVSLMAKMVQNKSVPEALLMLQHLPKKKGGEILAKLVKSAAANAKHNLNIDPQGLKVQTVDIGRGPKIKRVRAVGRGRMHKYEKHRSFVKVTLASK
ncbi:MAG: 50S ribosomal protein L22 [Candidatus Peribacteria bacterium]|nr:MAG: 50S ribosomal protein L22 [Candidatus Peribacteria bacterium]